MYERFIEYIDYFENHDGNIIAVGSGADNKTLSIPAFNYDTKFEEFIQDVYDSGIMVVDYLERIGEEDINLLIENADIELLRAVLTYLVREERFCYGTWKQSIKDKTFLRVLYRLQMLIEG